MAVTRRARPTLLGFDYGFFSEAGVHCRLAGAVCAALESGIIRSVEEGTPFDPSLDRETLSLLLDVLVAGGVLARTDGAFSLAFPIPPFMTGGDVLARYFKDGGSFARAVLASLAAPADDPSRNAPEPEWGRKRLCGIALAALDGEIQAVLDSAPEDLCGELLDIGAGHGLYSVAFAERFPSLHVTAADLPSVIPLTRELVSPYPCSDRISFLSLDFMRDEIPGEYDAVLCANVLHEEKRDSVLSKTFRALKPGGVIIADVRVSDPPQTLPSLLQKLAWRTGGKGSLPSCSEYKNIFTSFNFKNIKLNKIHHLHAIFTGKKNESYSNS